MITAEMLVLFLLSQDLKTLHERQAGVEHDRELAGEIATRLTDASGTRQQRITRPFSRV
jgi:hypothetical protein